MIGITRWRNKKGWLVFQLHYTADPDKRTVAWKQAAMDSMPDLQSFNREFEIDWTSTSGLPFYPAFYQKYVEERAYFIRVQPIPEKGVIYRGFDFGFRKPACVWLHHSIDGRVRILREFSPENIDVYQFRDAVRVISGELPFEALHPERHERAITWLDRLEPVHPWFKPGTIFVNFAGPEATATYSAPGQEKKEMNDMEVFQGKGMLLNIVNQRVSAGTYIIRNLMRQMDQTGPGLLVDPTCLTLIQGLAGGLTFGLGTKATPLDDEVAVHPVYSHLHDALRYAVCGFLNVSDSAVPVNPGLDKPQRDAEDRRREPPRFGPNEEANESAFWASVDFDS